MQSPDCLQFSGSYCLEVGQTVVMSPWLTLPWRRAASHDRWMVQYTNLQEQCVSRLLERNLAFPFGHMATSKGVPRVQQHVLPCGNVHRLAVRANNRQTWSASLREKGATHSARIINKSLSATLHSDIRNAVQNDSRGVKGVAKRCNSSTFDYIYYNCKYIPKIDMQSTKICLELHVFHIHLSTS